MIATNLETDKIHKIFSKQQKRAILLRDSSVKERLRILKSLEEVIFSSQEKIQNAIYNDFQKSAEESTISEIYPVLSEIREVRRNLKHWAKPKPVRPNLPFFLTTSSIIYEPKGVTLVISPWNYPFSLAFAPMISSIAAGNTVILKPSELTPNTSKVIEEIIEQSFDDDHVKVFLGDQHVAQELLKLPFNHVFFTGSPRVGKVVMEAAAKNLSSVTLELGGKSPAIVDSTADLKDTAMKIAWGKGLNAGQTCVAPDYLLVEKKIKDRLISELKVAFDSVYGLDDNYTAIVNKSHFDRLNSWLGSSLENGAKLEFGGRVDKGKNKIYPTIVSELQDNDVLLKEEIFGPILPLLTFEGFEETIDYINDREKPLALYIFSKSRKNINKIKRNTSAGTMCTNDCVLQFGHPELPFGGVNNSGFGKSHGFHGFLSFSNEKAYLKQRRGFTMAKTLYPPFSPLKKIILKFLLRYF